MGNDGWCSSMILFNDAASDVDADDAVLFEKYGEIDSTYCRGPRLNWQAKEAPTCRNRFALLHVSLANLLVVLKKMPTKTLFESNVLQLIQLLTKTMQLFHEYL